MGNWLYMTNILYVNIYCAKLLNTVQSEFSSSLTSLSPKYRMSICFDLLYQKDISAAIDALSNSELKTATELLWHLFCIAARSATIGNATQRTCHNTINNGQLTLGS